MFEDENLQQGGILGMYYYYQHSEYPLIIEYEIDDRITVKVTKMWKDHVQREMEKSSLILAPMNKLQIENYILDVVYKFIES